MSADVGQVADTYPKWAEVARASREALALMNYSISTRCLPDEEKPCGGDFAQHALAHMAALTAVIDHQMTHLNAPQGMFTDIYDHIFQELQHNCGREHP